MKRRCTIVSRRAKARHATFVICLDLRLEVSVDHARVLQAVGALLEARGGDEFVVSASGVVDGLARAIPAAEISFNDLDLRARKSRTSELLPIDQDDRVYEAFWEHFWDTKTCTYTVWGSRTRLPVLTWASMRLAHSR